MSPHFFLIFLLGGLVKGFNENAAFALFLIWMISSGILAPLFGFAALWDFTRAKRKHETDAGNFGTPSIQQPDPSKKNDESS